MSVRCSGDCRSMEQVGEKQDFESALTRHGLRHEDFVLSVHRPVAAVNDNHWAHDYAVTVVGLAAGNRRSYVGGPRHDWVARFVEDVTPGLYGPLHTTETADDWFDGLLATQPQRPLIVGAQPRLIVLPIQGASA